MKITIQFIFCFCILISCKNRNDLNSKGSVLYGKASKLFKNNMAEKDSLRYAIALLDSAIQTDKEQTKYYFTKYQIAIILKRYDLAISSCNDVLAFDKNNFVAFFQKGIAFNLANNLDSAKNSYETALGMIDKTKFGNEIFREYERILLFGLLDDSANFNSSLIHFMRRFKGDKDFSAYYQQLVLFNKKEYLDSYRGN